MISFRDELVTYQDQTPMNAAAMARTATIAFETPMLLPPPVETGVFAGGAAVVVAGGTELLV